MISSCNPHQSKNNTIGSNDSIEKKSDQNNSLSTPAKFEGNEIWQLDYYPDSILINRSINDNSGWKSSYAYNIQFSGDSCRFVGWHESWWNKLIKIDDKNYKINDIGYQYWELKFDSNNKLFMRHIYNKNHSHSQEDTGIFIPYHKVERLLTLDSLKHVIAKKMFAGTYNVVFHDTLNCERTITLDSNFGVKGIKDIVSYYIEPDIDWDFPVFNAFGFNKKWKMNNNGLSFKFSGDTLLIKDYKMIEVNGDFDHVEISNARIKMVKIR